MHIAEVVTIAKSLPLLRLNTYKSLILSYSADYRRIFGEKNSMNNAAIIAQTMNNAGFDVLPMEMDLSSRSSILSLIDEAQKHGEISMLVNVAGVSVFHRARIRVGDFGGNAFGSSEKGRLILYFYVCSSSLPYDSVKSRTCFLK